MSVIATLTPALRAGSDAASNPRTRVTQQAGHDLLIGTSTSWQGFELVSAYIGSEAAGYRATHLVLGRRGHRFAAPTELDPGLGPALWRRGLLDHYAVLRGQLENILGDPVSIAIDLTELPR